MPSSLMDYLAGSALTELAQAFAVKPGLKRPLPKPFYTPGPNKPVGTLVEFEETTGSRESAKVTNPNSPSQVAQGVTTVEKKVVAIGSREHYPIDLETIQALQQPGDMVRKKAGREVERQVKAFVDRFMNIETNAVHAAVLLGAIYVGSDGLIQTSSSSPVRTIDYIADAANRLTTNGAGSTYNIGDWDTASTAIVTKVKGLKTYVAKTYGYDITDVYYGTNVPEYLAKNTNFKEYLSRFDMFRNQFSSTGEIPDGVLGLKWHPVDTATSVASGSATSWASADFLGFSPDPADTSWYEFVQCGLPCPTGLTSDGEIKSALMSPDDFSKSFPVKYGVHSYSIHSADPIGTKLVTASYFLPVIKNKQVFLRGVCH